MERRANPGRRHLRGVSAREQRQYESIVKAGRARYGARVREVAARTVLKRHAAKRHRKGA